MRGALVEADQGDLVDGLEHLAGPLVIDCFGFCESGIVLVSSSG